jgi:hypothetical protein
VSEALLGAMEKGNTAAVSRWVATVKADAKQWRHRLQKSEKNPRVLEAAFPHLLREHLAHLALRRTSTALATKETSGSVRLGLWSGTVIQRLLFKQGLERKPASLASFKFWWRFVFDRKLLMPLVQPRGIYCFYSRELISALGELIAGQPCVELGAGDGTLSRFLHDAGVHVTPSDNGSWGNSIHYPDQVERIDAKAALKKHQPRVVLTSWAPPGNTFERTIFETPSVQTYVTIGSRHRGAAGNFDAYERQTAFEWSLDERLSALVLPPELDPAVYVFRRRQFANC